ncbi:hypothetical protein FW778_06295 [Ginsengibacter hankyongi]|uniref:Right handed beta helix domain-containing protein n=2 Tax=Ginsengibacter hankyongi TaxID=2607284 RepID=A0A5J5IM47_9BACT|nr:hypothetical protein FW778_06295 [Ginsengibacter hankyongi]
MVVFKRILHMANNAANHHSKKHFFNTFHFLLLLFSILSLTANGSSLLKKSLWPKENSPDSSPAISTKNTIYIKDFGAVADGVTNNTEAFQKASAFLEANGGTLIIGAGTYIVGKQKLSGSYSAGVSYTAEPILSLLNAKKPVIIKGYNAILKAASGLKFGSFNPVTGEKDSIRKEGNRSSYNASAFTFISIINCLSITIKGLTLDGNAGKLNIGPAFGPEGIQLSALGIGLYGNKNVSVADCYIHHCALDGIIVAWPGLKVSDPVYPHTITNVKCEYNGRQGLSWVGGNNLTVTDCEFSSTGKALNMSLPVISKPSAGIDIEIENSIIRNGSFINCFVYNNAGPGIISIGHDTYNINFKRCTFIGTTNSAAYPKSKGFSFDNCTFVGMVQRIYGSADKSKACFFKDCLFTMDSKMSPDRRVFGDTWEFYEGQNVIFDHCTFDAATKHLPTVNTPEIVFLNCTFSQNSNENFNAAAIFKGTTKFVMKGKGTLITSQSDFTGKIIYNNQVVTDIRNVRL